MKEMNQISPMQITQERPDTTEAKELIAELESYLAPLYPPANQHGLSVERLLQEGVAFFITRYSGEPAGCGGVKLFGTEYAEIKRMYVRPQFRGLGLAKLMLNHLEETVFRQGIQVLRLETGIYQLEANGLYERAGYRRIGPFGSYVEDPLNVFYEKRLSGETDR